MILSTTSYLEGKKVKEYRGVVFGEAIIGIDFIKDFTASITNFIGGRAEEYEQELINARAQAVSEMIIRAEKVGANCLLGVKIDIDSIGIGEKNGLMLMVSASATAAVIEQESK